MQRNDADMTDAQIDAIGEPLEARAREIRARGDSAEIPGERDELIHIITTHYARFNDDPAKLAKAHRRYLRDLAAGALDYTAGRLVGDAYVRRKAARVDADQHARDSVSHVLGTLHDARRAGLPSARNVEADARRDSAMRDSTAWSRPSATTGDGEDN